MADRLIVRGAREHNLKNVSLDLPRDSLIVFTGLSGSGKSSLAFDTIFAEGQRRYVESLSSYARQFLGQMDKPDVDFIEGLSPAVSIDQKSTSRNPRSTVGTITEVYDYLRLLFARIGKPHCPECGRPISRQSPQAIVDKVLGLPEGSRFQVLSPLVRERKGEFVDLFADLQTKGFSRARVDGATIQLSEPPKLKKQEKHTVEVVVDRLTVKESAKRRLTDSVETALGLSGGMVVLDFVDLPDDDPERERMYSEHLYCPYDDLSFEELEPRSFSFNSPFGACPECTGIGTRMEVDPELVVPDEDKSLDEGAIHPWSHGHTKEYFGRQISALADALGFRTDIPWAGLPQRAKKALLYGHKIQTEVRYRNRYGRERAYTTPSFEGAVQYVKRRHSEAESDSSRERFEGYMREVPCPSCEGTRLKPIVLAVTVMEKSIAEVAAMSISECAEFLGRLKLNARDKKIAERVLKEVNERLRFLVDVGLDYLSLNRAAGTLSGGEAQRIRLATQIGSGLVGVLYVLDEPSIGLHQRDNHRLIETLVRLRDMGNTLIVVEHDEDTIKVADWVVDIGPGAGEHGGKVVHSGSLKELLANDESLTGQYLAGKRAIPVPGIRRPVDPKRLLTVHGARENNLQDIDVSFPLGVLTAVTGVSGSGKSTLVNDILYTHLARELNGAKSVPGRHTRVDGDDLVDKVVHVDQSPIGRTPRSNPATYTGVFDHVRRLFAETMEAKVRGYMPGRFSFNVKGGRCENCSGDGTIKIEMNFLPDVYVPCEVCHGARYNRETLEVHYKGKSIAEVLDMPIEEGLEFFEAVPTIARHLRTLNEVGLGYVRLGQSAPTLSGGEAQRVKLASELQKRSTGRTVYVLDEPTTGLHFEDISKLITVLSGLVDKGNTVIVIEHNLDVVKTADWVVDMGPEGGNGGGLVVAEGTPEEVAAVPGSHTGKFLQDILGADRIAAGTSAPAARKPARKTAAKKTVAARTAPARKTATARTKKAAAEPPAAKKATRTRKA
ncbi:MULTISPECIES: excinuclease ABC subunit UvrA [unclassified Streptomyces]|uniref:excinuclease ABC subunit UvrA n=1 Tax=Streptomyces TaxID=1883 RepID=UPI0001C19368|nr:MULTISPECIES: excinuclease ABC subunit UvrA [unclassified Streptomyces]MYR70492.1 excinuclease ABC subunit UvrA [Streptomyces sp. SID4939]MYT64847.1 excinuclease ABC subunit UvrA [Streptomyces sp. SID8357]MYT87607.1 excinuclease ABC subunit UvrA [Streptomyces sp. SID8360]MYW36777.1 excinuclease ABC subunit UvrA [Streptomyces sp. SID1]AEN09293.1 excinuclease ABC, A subunit [Streptomyces sp. SirexAA-E]